jgi:hypothetical protein
LIIVPSHSPSVWIAFLEASSGIGVACIGAPIQTTIDPSLDAQLGSQGIGRNQEK